jgi:tubulin delta
MPLQPIVSRAYEMFLSKAYLHQYENHKIYSSDFEECFVKLEDIISNYKAIS